MLNLEESIQAICGNNKQLMIFGFEHCNYIELKSSLIRESIIKKVFDYLIAIDPASTIEGNHFTQFKLKEKYYTLERACKSALVSLVFENYKRQKNGQDLIPLLFCVDIEGNEYPLKAENIATREDELNSLATFKELRRCYKLCFEFENQEINKIAKATFKFVKVLANSLEEIKPFWEDSEWKLAWDERKKCKVVTTWNRLKSPYRWEVMLSKAITSEA